MFTTGTKLLIGSSVAAAVFAVVYGVTQDGTLGVIGLVSAAVALAIVAGINTFVRDSNVSAMDPDAFETCAAAQATARPSLWPLLVALGATTVTLGLVTTSAYFIVGIAIVVAGALEWLVQGWSERASIDAEFNDDVRERLIDPLELPLAGAVLAGAVVYSFSRVMLGLPTKTATVVAFSIVGLVVLLGGTVIGAKRSIRPAALTGTLSVALVALLVTGTAAGLNGEREGHAIHTPGDLAEDDECGPEETDADEKASQSVGAQANVAAELTYADGELLAITPGFDEGATSLTLPRSNPTNVLFHNESDEPARLVVELHPAVDTEGVAASPERLCTAMVEEGGTQLLTVVFTRSTKALGDDSYAFTVAGTDAAVEVVVP